MGFQNGNGIFKYGGEVNGFLINVWMYLFAPFFLVVNILFHCMVTW